MERRAEARVAREHAGWPIEAWLAKRFTYLGEAAWEEMLRAGRLSVNGRAAPPGQALAAGDLVAFAAPHSEEPEVDADYAIVYEDADYLVVDKPALLPCHPGGAFFEHSLSRLLEARYGRASIATRLDRETSGLVLACRSARATAAAQAQRAAGTLGKEYLALVHGAFPERVEARGHLVPDGSSLVRKKRRYVAGPPPSGARGAEGCETSFRLVRSVGGFSLVSARAATGRTHQIRATLLGLGFPIAGDKLYGLDEGCFIRFCEGRSSAEDRALLLLPHQALHCARLAFEDGEGRRLELWSDPPWGLDVSGVWTRERVRA